MIYIPIVALGFGAYKLYLLAIPQYRESDVNEYMIVLRDGEPVKAGSGIYYFTWYGDKVIKFPTHLRSLEFASEQVTSEMMGVRVTGTMIWSPLRDEGLFKLYKAFGDELMNENSSFINEKIQNLAISVIRDKVANLTIEAILRDRNQIRDGIKKSAGEVLKGWGVWLETIEISEVHIVSGSLFQNLQTPHREKMRLHADKIERSTENTIRSETMEKNNAFSKESTEAHNKFQKSKMEADSEMEIFRMDAKIKKQ